MLLESIIGKLEATSTSIQVVQNSVSEMKEQLAVVGERDKLYAERCPVNAHRVKSIVEDVIREKDYIDLVKRPKRSREIIMWVVVIVLSLMQMYSITSSKQAEAKAQSVIRNE